MSNIPESKAESQFSMVTIHGDRWDFSGPAWIAWRIQHYASAVANAARAQGSIVKNAVHLYALGKDGQGVAQQIMDDEFRCGNEVHRWPIPHPHWTDQLLELALYADSLPSNSNLRTSAFRLAQDMLAKAQEQKKA